MAQQRADVVHLSVAGAGIAAAAVDLFHDHRGFGEAQARAAVLGRNHRSEPAGPGQRIDERLGVGTLLIELAVVLVRELRAQRAHRIAQIWVAVAGGFQHRAVLGRSLRNANHVRLNLAVDGAVPEPADDRFGSDVGCFTQPRRIARLEFIA